VAKVPASYTGQWLRTVLPGFAERERHTEKQAASARVRAS
jgi:hypothetical protein